jgi:light-regulated signal transduction histidine kinase (bacteriophytochrome)
MFEYAPDDWWDNGAIEMEVSCLKDFPLTKRVLVERCMQQVSLSDPDADPDEVAYMQEFDIENLLMLPMVFQDRVVGLVEIMDRSERPPTEQEIALVRMLADQAANAIENARLYEQTQQELSARRQAEARLKSYTAKLEWSNRELQDFAYVASHDLQEPLRKIQAFGDRLEAIYGQTLDERGRDYLARMRNAAGRMQTLINDLLTYSRVTTKAQPFQMVDLEKVARGVVSDLEVRIEQVGGRVEVGELPAIEADPTQMRQLLQNLVSNGLKFHRQDEIPVVNVYARCCNGHENRLEGDGPDGTTMCQIIVKDNGIGFDEKYADRIFQVFQRLHGRGEYEGTGIGLATSRKIAERHGGDITAKSKPGQGATFIVTLPVRQNKGEETL